MANPAEILLFSIFDLLKGSLFIAIPLFILLIIGKWLKEKIQAKTKWKWLFCAFATTYAILWVIILFMYFTPFFLGVQESGIGEIPSIFAPPAGSFAASYLSGLIKVTVSTLVLTVLLLPLEFIGAFIFDWVNAKMPKSNPLVNLFITAYIASLVSSAIVLFIIPEAVTGLLYYIYFG